MFKSVVICCCFGIVFGDPNSKITEIQSHLDGRIIGGEGTTIEVAPYQVSIGIGRSHYCGGSIIADKWILTAGHCAKMPKSYYEVRAGSTYTQSGGSVHQVSLVLKHENYTVNEQGIPINDIALFRLSKPMVMDATRRIIKLFEKNEEPKVGTSAVITGWGTVTFPGSVSPSQLHIVKVPIISEKECAFYYAGLSQINDGQLCAMDSHGGKDACQGDSGGPLVVGDGLAGIVSWGEGCAIFGKPGVYTKVSYYRDWIEESMKA